MNFEFASPAMLYWLFLLPLLGLLLYFQKLPSVTVPSVRPVRRLRAKRRLSFLSLSLLIAATLLILALARPRSAAGEEKVRPKGIDMVLALDLSGSMRAMDRPEGMTDRELLAALQENRLPSRIDAAKNELRKFIEKRPNDRIGLIGFADQAYSFVPPTLDHGMLLERLAALSPGELGEMTGIASPIGLGVQRMKNSSAPRRVLVLFTDGANTVTNAVSPEEAARIAKEKGVILHVVGIGSPEAYTWDGFRAARWVSDFDEEKMQSLVQIADGRYFRAADTEALARTMKEIDALEKTAVTAPRPVLFREYAPLFALAAAGMLLLGVISTATWQFRLP